MKVFRSTDKDYHDTEITAGMTCSLSKPVVVLHKLLGRQTYTNFTQPSYRTKYPRITTPILRMEEQISEQVEDVMDSLDSLDRVLRPLLSVPLEESLGKLTALERSKMQVLLAYVTQDLIYSKLHFRD